MKSIPMVYEGPLDELPKKSFNTVQISIDARLDSDLNWKEAHQKAQKFKEEGFQILWDLDLGLFNELPLPLSDTTQYKSLHLSLDHFFETLWPAFKEQTIGAVLYKGPLDLTHKWNWDPDQLFSLQNQLMETFETPQSLYNATGIKCKDFQSIKPTKILENNFGHHFLKFFCLKAAVDYFEILSAQFPAELLPYVLFDLRAIHSKLQTFQLLEQEAFDFIQIALKHPLISIPHAMGWQSKSFLNGFIGRDCLEYNVETIESNLGILVPKNPILEPKTLNHYESIVNQFERSEDVRYLSERQLTMDWQGLDTLLVFSTQPETNRKLEGFIAAGGQVVYAESPLGLSEEASFKDYKKQMEPT